MFELHFPLNNALFFFILGGMKRCPVKNIFLGISGYKLVKDLFKTSENIEIYKEISEYVFFGL